MQEDVLSEASGDETEMLALSTLAGEVQMVSSGLQDMMFMEHSSPPPLPSHPPQGSRGSSPLAQTSRQST